MKFTLFVVANEFPFDNRRVATFQSKDQGICEFLDSSEYRGEKIVVVTEDTIRRVIEKFAKESDVDGRAILFEFTDTDLRELKTELGL
jgi:hypothetical protein